MEHVTSPRLSGRRILVTGAASGMGRSIGRLFAAHGARVALVDRDAGGLSAVARETGQLAITADLSSEQAIIGAIGRVEDEFGGLDGLVNGAGILREKPFADHSTADFDDIIGINLRGPFLLMRHCLPLLQASGRAAIVNIASNVALNPHPGLAIYSASKAALAALTQAAAKELGPAVRVNAICPGIIRTAMTEAMFQEGGHGEAAVAATIALGRPGSPEEVADLALYLMSDESSFVSGAVVPVNGGALY